MKTPVKIHASHRLIVIEVSAAIQKAHQLMLANNLRHLPVINDFDSVIGILSRRDVERAAKTWLNVQDKSGEAEVHFDYRDAVGDYMSWPVVTIDENQPVSAAAELMVEGKISSLLVQRDGFSVGIVTSEDLLRILIEDRKSKLATVRDGVLSSLYNSPIGAFAEKLSALGI